MNFFTSFKRFFSDRWNSEQVASPEAWFFLLSCSAVLLIVILVMNVIMFVTVMRGEGNGVTTVATSSTPMFSQSSLNNVQSIFASRAAEETSYTTGGYVFIDPSQ